ncbi:serine/threonine-protein kinase prp4 [Ophiocordyceps sinensis CO18]|nr:serine/threonine-protein kinase prp4 [Ophiocordyceps sinensis CO18]
MPEAFDEEAEIERRRKRREELLSMPSSANPLLLHAVANAAEKAAGAPAQTPAQVGTPQSPATTTNRGSPSSMATRDEHSPEPASSVLSDEGLMNTYGHAVEGDNDGPSAADYDPTMDIVEDQIRIKQRLAKTGDGETQPVADSAQDASPDEAADEEGGGGFDMFAEEFDEERYAAERKKRSKVPGPQRGLLEGDDKDGYYKIRIGQLFHDRYELKATLGQGAFARVARATDTVTNKTVALKIIRNNYALRRAAYKEIAIVHKLNERDAANKKHIVRIDHSFEVDGHVCMVFEDMDMNLREVLRKFGHNVGISLHATRRFAWQIFTALEHMRKSHVIHADLKPDNILINHNRQVVKVCDLGAAIDRDDAATAHSVIMPYLISRFYRAPEVILGMDYDFAIDVWSIGCTLFELFTGKILFPGSSNNQMIKVMMEVRGRMNPKYYKRGQLWRDYFDDKNNFLSVEYDHVIHRSVVRQMVTFPGRNLASRLNDAGTGMAEHEKRELDLFRELLESCLTFHPEKRITPGDALKHPFFTKATTHPH